MGLEWEANSISLHGVYVLHKLECLNFLGDDFEGGHSKGNPSTTYGNPPLASEENFHLVTFVKLIFDSQDYMEVWNVHPPSIYEQEKYSKKSGKEKFMEIIGNRQEKCTGR